MLSHSELTAFFAKRGQVLLDPTSLLSVRDCTPLPIYGPGTMQVVLSRRCNVRRLRAIAGAFRDHGVTTLRPDLRAASLPSPNRIVAEVRFGHLGQVSGTDDVHSDLTYFLQKTGDGVRICMLEVVRCPAYALATERQFQRSA